MSTEIQSQPTFDPVPLLTEELKLPAASVSATVRLLDEGGTVPFIARYRKEATGGLDEVQIRAIQERQAYLLELEQRRQAVLESIEGQGKLTDELRRLILTCDTKAALEDLYLPYKPKRRTRATIARERGLEPLALRVLAQPAQGEPLAEAAAFVDQEQGVDDAEAALAGARDIAAETVAETAEVRGMLRRAFAAEGQLRAEMVADQKGKRTKFEQYYDFCEPVAKIPSHRYLALRRGEREKVLKVNLEAEAERYLPRMERVMALDPGSPFSGQLRLAVAEAYQRLLAPSVETDIRIDLKERADEAAVEVFANNLRNLLLAAPLGARPVIGIDPGLRTGCKCVALDETGKYLGSVTIYLSQGEGKVIKARADLLSFITKHKPFAVAVGNGTGGRETETFLRRLLKEEQLGKDVVAVQVNEAGASVYSASDLAREEFPELDLTLRGSISIGRRLQDPLAELVKIDPKAIGVGQYQHDVHQPLLKRKLGEVVESCVNQVGVELNTASAPLLARVAGVGPKLANKIVAHREASGAFRARKELLKVSGMGPRTFEQAAGFLRVRGGAHPLDVSAVHPERYKLVERMAADLGVELSQLMGSAELVERIELQRYVGDGVGEPTLRDIIDELRKPGRDPRQSFEPPSFRDDVTELEDLTAGMQIEGVVTNVTAFGAFVDVGVHQDGLVHISKLSDRFVRDPNEVAKVGDKLKVRVLDVDLERRRISLSARSEQERPAPRSDSGGRRPGPGGDGRSGRRPQGRPQGRRPERGRKSAAPAQAPQGAGFRNNPFADLLKKK